MVRNHSFRSIATALVSGMLTLALLSGCSNTKKDKAPGATGSLKRIAPSRTSVATRKAKTVPKPSALARNATKLSAAFNKNPANSKVAINYIYHLRSLGMQQQAVNILYRAYQANPKNPRIASEYGRLLLGSGKAVQAKRVLDRIDPNQTKDWRTLSALGTIEAREGRYEKATHYFRAARELAPQKASVLNNLGLSIALGGHPDEAENLLRNADDSGRFGARLRQNLALVLALQGKYDDAQAMATTDLPPKKAAKNIAYLKRMLATTDRSDGIELMDETIKPVANRVAKNNAPVMNNDGPATTASIDAPTSLAPPMTAGPLPLPAPAQE